MARGQMSFGTPPKTSVPESAPESTTIHQIPGAISTVSENESKLVTRGQRVAEGQEGFKMEINLDPPETDWQCNQPD